MRSQPRRDAIFDRLRMAEVRRLLRARDEPAGDMEIVGRLGGHPRAFTAGALGECLGLTLIERADLGIRTIEAFDRTPADCRDFYRDRKRLRDRERLRRRRAEAAKIAFIRNPFSPRASTVLTTIQDLQGIVYPLTAAHVARLVANATTFKSRTGQAPQPATHRQAVKRALDELEAAGHVVCDVQTNERGHPERLIRLMERPANVSVSR